MLWIYIAGAIFLFFTFVIFFGAPYVPSHKKDVKKVFEFLKISKKDLIVDVGSGDGIILRLAAQRGASAVGYELQPILVLISRLASLRYPKVATKLANFWRVELPKKTTLVYAFSVSRDEKKLAAKMQSEASRLNRTVKLLCYSAPLTGLKPDLTFEAYALYSFHPLQGEKAQV
ncbi:MAG: hypothetical protein JWM52_737 [Candidatus Saccharibacteria bacterium]|nr:hypothetical protein [Candidatus Saccharibacteria bacterium]